MVHEKLNADVSHSDHVKDVIHDREFNSHLYEECKKGEHKTDDKISVIQHPAKSLNLKKNVPPVQKDIFPNENMVSENLFFFVLFNSVVPECLNLLQRQGRLIFCLAQVPGCSHQLEAPDHRIF